MPSLVDPVLPPGRLCGGPQPTLRSGRLTLRPWAIEDTPAVVSAYADPDIQRWHVRSMSVDEATDWIEATFAAWQEEREASWAIEKAGAAVGRMTLKLRPSHGLAEAAYWILPQARGHGLAPLALLTATAWAFGTGLHRVELEHSTQNPTSCRVATKAGFSAEGTKRSAGLHADGWHDMHVHGLIDDQSTGSPRVAV